MNSARPLFCRRASEHPLSATSQIESQTGVQLTGTLMVIVGSVLLASKGIFAKALYAQGLDFETVVAFRAVLAIPGFLFLGWIMGGFAPLKKASKGDLLTAAFAGFVCYYLGATTNFYALTLIDASIERALLFSYPALVVIVTSIASRRRPGPWTTLAVVATYLGIALVVGVLNLDLLKQNLTGALWVMFCSATIAYYFIVSGKLTHSLSSSGFTVVAMTSAGLSLAIHYQLRHGWQNLTMASDSLLLMLALAVFVTVLPLYLVAEGVRRVGAQRAAIASTIGPPATVVMAAWLLQERMSWSQFLGMCLIVAGILLLELRRFHAGRKK